MLRVIQEFLPEGTRLRSPAGLSFDPDKLVAVEYSQDYVEAGLARTTGIIKLHTNVSVITLTFARNMDGSDADVFEIAARIRKAQTQ